MRIMHAARQQDVLGEQFGVWRTAHLFQHLAEHFEIGVAIQILTAEREHAFRRAATHGDAIGQREGLGGLGPW